MIDTRAGVHDSPDAADRQLNPRQLDIPTFLTQTFWDSGIVINMIGYKVVSQEETKAEEQFKVIEKLPLPGKYVTVSASKELAATLQKALGQTLRYWVDLPDNVPPRDSLEGLDVTSIGANNQWLPGGLDPSTYRLRVHADRRLSTDISIQRGDLLLVDLVPAARGFRFERSLFSRSAYPWKPAQDHSGWRLALLQNQVSKAGELQMLTTLEKRFDRREDTLQMLKPRLTWIEVQPPTEVPTPYSQRWGYQAGYPAPAWSIDVPAWPVRPGTEEPARPVLRVWWNPDQDTAPAITLDRGADFQRSADLIHRSVLVENDQVHIANVTVEQRPIQTRPGVIETKSCLVVHLRHSPDKPVWVQVRGLNLTGQEHRFFTRAGHYTGLFWPVTVDGADVDLQSLSLYSLPAFKRHAERRGFRMEMRDLSLPAASDVRPRPLIDLK